MINFIQLNIILTLAYNNDLLFINQQRSLIKLTQLPIKRQKHLSEPDQRHMEKHRQNQTAPSQRRGLR